MQVFTATFDQFHAFLLKKKFKGIWKSLKNK